MNNEQHKRHKFDNIKSWINFPSDLDDVSIYWNFCLIKECECGKTKKCTASIEEVRQFIENNTCRCGMVNKHKTEADCMNQLFLRIKVLESKLDKICNVLSSY